MTNNHPIRGRRASRLALTAAFASLSTLTVGSLASATAESTPATGPAEGSAPAGPTDYRWTPNPTFLAGQEGSVNIIIWAGYAEAAWTEPFTQLTGCAVNVKNADSSDQMVSLMQTGEYDSVSASGDATERLMSGGEVVEVNPADFSSYATIYEDLKLKPWNSADGKPMGIPHGRGANLLVYNTEAFPTAPDSWAPMFTAGNPSDGAVSVYDSPIYIADAALYLMATKPELKITDPYALDQAQFDAAIELLNEQKKIVGQYWAVYTDQQAALEGGSALAGTTWQVIVNLATANAAKIAAIKPKEGATGWSDTWMLSSKAKNPNCAKLWMDWIASPWANAQVAEYFGEAPSNPESCGLTADAKHCETFHAGETDYWKDVWYWTTATEKCRDGRTDVTCVPYTAWVDAWNKLRAG